MHPKADKISLSHLTKKTKGVMKKTKKTKTKMQMLRRNSPVMKSVESVLRLEESLWWEKFVNEVGFELGVKE